MKQRHDEGVPSQRGLPSAAAAAAEAKVGLVVVVVVTNGLGVDATGPSEKASCGAPGVDWS